MTTRQKIKLISFGVAILIAGFQYYSSLGNKSPIVPLSSTPFPTIISQTASSSSAVLSEKVTTAVVTKVTDGDTFQINTGQKVRMIGMNTPETVDPRRGVQCFGKEASEKTKELLTGKTVKLEKDVSETDKYGRLLRYVYVDDLFINQYLVAEGYATSSSYPPDIAQQEIFRTAEKQAREAKRGLWATCK